MGKSKMTPHKINYELAEAGYTQVKVAEVCGVSQTAVNLVIHSKGTSDKVRRFIAKVIGRKAEDIWDIRDNPTKVGRPSSLTGHSVAA